MNFLSGKLYCGIENFRNYCLLAFLPKSGGVAQLVEQRTENPCVVGSIPTLATTSLKFHIAHEMSKFPRHGYCKN